MRQYADHIIKHEDHSITIECRLDILNDTAIRWPNNCQLRCVGGSFKFKNTIWPAWSTWPARNSSLITPGNHLPMPTLEGGAMCTILIRCNLHSADGVGFFRCYAPTCGLFGETFVLIPSRESQESTDFTNSDLDVDLENGEMTPIGSGRTANQQQGCVCPDSRDCSAIISRVANACCRCISTLTR